MISMIHFIWPVMTEKLFFSLLPLTKKVEVGNDQEKAHTPKTEVGKKLKLTIRYLDHEYI